MRVVPEAIQKLIAEFSKLPGIGPKTSERFVFYLLKQEKKEVDLLCQFLKDLKERVCFCQRCHAYSSSPTCVICADQKRDQQTICVVAEPRDIIIIEQTNEFHGVYHVLGGVINHLEGIAPHHLKIPELIERVKNEKIKEVIIATNPDMEGDMTANFIAQQLADLHVTVTKIARGLPTGSDLEFADETTLRHALQARRKL